jgi:hypothetical protein
MTTKRFKVLRALDGDRFYQPGETREMAPADAKHLVDLGALEEIKASERAPEPEPAPTPQPEQKAEEPPLNKAEPAPQNKAARGRRKADD